MDVEAARKALEGLPSTPLGYYPTPVEEMPRLREGIGGGPRLLVKRDDAISFGFGGNKVRKLQLVAARALAEGADTLVTTGGVQSNHCRATAAAAAKLGLRCAIVASGEPPGRATGNALLHALLGAEIHYVASRGERAAALRALTERLRREGRRPHAIPLGASTPIGALAFAKAVGELLSQVPAPDAIVHASSSGGTQAGLVAGCVLYGTRTRVVGVSADEPAGTIAATVRSIVGSMGELLGVDGAELASAREVEVDDAQVGPGYGEPTEASLEAQDLAARREALFVDHFYTAKALAGLIARVRTADFHAEQTVLFWHTGGQVALFA